MENLERAQHPATTAIFPANFHVYITILTCLKPGGVQDSTKISMILISES